VPQVRARFLGANLGVTAGRGHSRFEVVVCQTRAKSAAWRPAGKLLAEALRRPQCEGCARVYGQITILAPQSGKAQTGQGTGRLELEQLPSLCTAGERDGRNRVWMDGEGSGDRIVRGTAASVPPPRLASKKRTRTWGTRLPVRFRQVDVELRKSRVPQTSGCPTHSRTLRMSGFSTSATLDGTAL